MFCRICGNELHEQAIVCPKCGCAVDNIKPIKKQGKETTSTISGAVKVLNYITVVLICAALTCFALSIVMARNWTYRWRLNYGTLLAFFIVSIASFGTALSTFILSFKKETNSTRFVNDVLFIISTSFLFVAIFSLLD